MISSKRISCFLLFLFIACISANPTLAQQDARPCKVDLADLRGTYNGDCKNGYAHGKGEAAGLHRYVGKFKNGLPNGEGTYYYNDSVYYVGNFQDGIREGKGIAYYLRAGKPDSLEKGYWSANIYRGEEYKTYQVTDMPPFDQVDISPSKGSGNTLTIEITTTSGAIQGSASFTGVTTPKLTVNDVIALDGSFIRKREVGNSLKYTTTYELSKFPVRLQVLLSNARAFTIELYKAADWKIALFQNK